MNTENLVYGYRSFKGKPRKNLVGYIEARKHLTHRPFEKALQPLLKTNNK